MLKPECIICNDYKKIKSQTEACEKAYYRLERFTRTLDIPRNINPRVFNGREYVPYLRGLDMNKPSTRLMCGGACSKVSIQSSQRTFELLNNEYKKIVYFLLNCDNEDNFNSVKRNCLDIFRGLYFSKFYRSLASIRFNKD